MRMWRRLIRVRWVLLIPDPCFLSIGAIDVLLGLGGPHALLEDVFEVKVEVKLQILWLLLQPRVLLLLPGPSFEDEGIEAERRPSSSSCPLWHGSHAARDKRWWLGPVRSGQRRGAGASIMKEVSTGSDFTRTSCPVALQPRPGPCLLRWGMRSACAGRRRGRIGLRRPRCSLPRRILSSLPTSTGRGWERGRARDRLKSAGCNPSSSPGRGMRRPRRRTLASMRKETSWMAEPGQRLSEALGSKE
jgi:hypothetical protein